MKIFFIILIVLLSLAIIIVSVSIGSIRKRGVGLWKGAKSVPEPSVGPSAVSPALAQAVEDSLVRRESLERVMALVRHRYEVSVADVEDMLGFSWAMSEEYLAELSARGLIESVGKTGRGEIFRVK